MLSRRHLLVSLAASSLVPPANALAEAGKETSPEEPPPTLLALATEVIE
jgi:hypothetical protein